MSKPGNGDAQEPQQNNNSLIPHKNNHKNNYVRTTISLDTSIQKKLREIQSGLIKSDGNYWSFSRVINMVLAGGLVGADNFGLHHWKSIMEHLEDGNKQHKDTVHTLYINKVADLKN